MKKPLTMLLAGMGVALFAPPSWSIAPDEATTARLALMPVPFVANEGQWNADAAFAAPTFAGTLFVTREGKLVYRLSGARRGDARAIATKVADAPATLSRNPDWVLAEAFVDRSGYSLRAAPQGVGAQPGNVSYLVGEASRHRTDLHAFDALHLGEVFEGVDVLLRATGRNVEKIFTVAPQQDAARIRVRVDGADALSLGSRGELIAATGNGPIVYTAPIAFQIAADGTRRDVAVAYALDAASRTYGFTLGAYDRARPLVIDPLLQSTYSGGGADDTPRAIAIHPATGDVYIGGGTLSTDYPGTTGGVQASLSGAGTIDAFVSRFNAALTTRLQSTYLGGSADDEIYAMAIHPLTGNVYVAGETGSSNFPYAASGFQATKGAGSLKDGFVVSLTPDLKTVTGGTFIGGTGQDNIYSIAIHPVSGDVYVAGFTNSNTFPGSTGGFQSAPQGNGDGFVSWMSASLTTLRQSTYFGGITGSDQINALAISPVTGEIIIAGQTFSSDLPNTLGAPQISNFGGFDAFVARLNSTLTANPQTTYLGGSGTEIARGVAVLPNGNIVVSGVSNSASLAATGGPLLGGQDAVVVLYNPLLTQIVAGRALGGTTTDIATAVVVHPATGEIYVTGGTNSTPFTALAGGAQTTYAAGFEVFISRLDSGLNVVQSTYFGAFDDESASVIAVHPVSGEIYTSGTTHSINLPGLSGGAQTVLNDNAAGQDGFVARHTFDLRNAAVAQPAAFSFAPVFNAPTGSLQTSAPATISIGANVQPVAVMGGNLAQFCVSSGPDCTCNVRSFSPAATTLNNGQSVCVRQYAPPISPGGATARLLVGGGAANFFVGTGTTGCSLDVDGNNAIDALTDGLILLRAMLGLTGTAVTDNAIGSGAARPTWALLQPYLNGNCGASFAP